MTLHCVFCLWGAVLCAADLGEPVQIPSTEDVIIDGRLDEWRDRDPFGSWDRSDLVVWGVNRYDGPDDLGGRCWLGWDGRHLYLAAEVVDDQHRQSETGENLWRGDHIVVLIDADRRGDLDVREFNADDFQIGLSPGTLGKTDDPLFSQGPEAYVWRPETVHAMGDIRVAAKKTPRGYSLEAAIPWRLLGARPESGHAIGIDVCFSDTDGREPVQETLASLLPGPWRLGTTDRLLEARLVGEAVPAPPDQTSDIGRPSPDAGLLPSLKNFVTVRPPRPPLPPDFTGLSEGGAIVFSAGSRTWRIASRSSEPGGGRELNEARDDGWDSFETLSDVSLVARTRRFSLTRSVEQRGRRLEIRDRIVNRTKEPLPLMVRHVMEWPESEVARLTLSGREILSRRGMAQNAMNPTLLVEHPSGVAVALAAGDDVFRLHHRTFCLRDMAGLADNDLVLAPNKEYEQVWHVYAMVDGGYWDLINAMRTEQNANFRIEGGFVFVDPRRASGQTAFTTAQMEDWLDRRAAVFPAIMMYHSLTNQALHGLEFRPEGDYLADLRALVSTIRAARPRAAVLHYFHCFICGDTAAGETDPADRLLDADGKQVCYGGDPRWPIFIPTDSNRFGRQMTELAMDMVARLDLDGIYWDEQQYSYQQYHYGDPWDGFSGEIDPETHELVRKRSHVTLLSAGFRNDLMRRLLEQGKKVVCNSPPMTGSDATFRAPRFTETGLIAYLTDTHLFTPIGLGDHLTERTHADTVRAQMRFLEHGCLYYYYSPSIPVENPGLARWMFPITPIALGPGHILGEERILTVRSGRFSWGDARLPDIDVHVVSTDGEEIEGSWRRVTEEGCEWVELELPDGCAAAIVRRS